MEKSEYPFFSFNNYSRLAPYVLCIFIALIPWWSMDAPGSYVSATLTPSADSSSFLSMAHEYLALPGAAFTVVGLIILILFSIFLFCKIVLTEIFELKEGNELLEILMKFLHR